MSTAPWPNNDMLNWTLAVLRVWARRGAWAALWLGAAVRFVWPLDAAEESRAIGPGIRWQASGPLVGPAERPLDPCHAIKDPSAVFHAGKWRLFCTIRSAQRTHQIEYLSFADWNDAAAPERQVLAIADGYFCAPQVFYFRPTKLWYLIYQVADSQREPALQPAYSTTADLTDASSWTRPTLLYAQMPDGIKSWIDFWVICDASRAHLFFTSLDGRMWRAETSLGDFPRGWSTPRVALQADIFEASHTYRVDDLDPIQYLTVVEAQADGRRYYKAYLADQLDGEWRPLADSREQPFAGPANVRFDGIPWSDSFSHGEILRSSNDETLPIRSRGLRFLFQGVSDAHRLGKAYGAIPWRLGLLEQVE